MKVPRETIVVGVFFDLQGERLLNCPKVRFYLSGPTCFLEFVPDGSFGWEYTFSPGLAVLYPEMMVRAREAAQIRSELDMQKEVVRLLGRGCCGVRFVRCDENFCWLI